MCGSFLCATNLWATFMKRPHVCFQTWAKFTIVRKKTNTQAFILFLALLIIMVCSAIMSCYYQADLMLANASTLIHYLFPYTTVGTEVQPMMFWVALIIRDLTMLAYSLYSALACSIMIEFYVCVTALHQDLLTICKSNIFKVSYGYGDGNSDVSKSSGICEWLLGRTCACPSHHECIQPDPGNLSAHWGRTSSTWSIVSFLWFDRPHDFQHFLMERHFEYSGFPEPVKL